MRAPRWLAVLIVLLLGVTLAIASHGAPVLVWSMLGLAFTLASLVMVRTRRRGSVG